MKILHVNYHENRGGAGRAAWRLHRLFLESGMDSHLLVAEKNSSDPRTYQAFSPGELRKIHLMQRLEANLNRMCSRKLHPWPRSYNFFKTTLPETIASLKPDVVIFHWMNGAMLSVEQFPKITAPTIWLLHDCWAFCGAEHCIEWQNNSFINGYDSEFSLDARTFRRKQTAWKNWNIPIVASSSWMEEQCKKSLLFRDHQILRGKIPFPAKLFSPAENRENIRKIFGFPRHKKIILFGALDAAYKNIKGADLFSRALAELDPEIADNTVCVLCGGNTPIDLPLPVYFAGFIADNNLLKALYQAVDVVVCPSRQEAFGQIALEASACGTPVAAFAGTGHDSTIIHLKTGYLAKMEDYSDLARGINYLLGKENRQIGSAAESFVHDTFSSAQIAAKWQEILETVQKRQ